MILLPAGLQFFAVGWWVIHAVAIYLVYSYAYRKGRQDERRGRGDRGAGNDERSDERGPQRHER